MTRDAYAVQTNVADMPHAISCESSQRMRPKRARISVAPAEGVLVPRSNLLLGMSGANVVEGGSERHERTNGINYFCRKPVRHPTGADAGTLNFGNTMP